LRYKINNLNQIGFLQFLNLKIEYRDCQPTFQVDEKNEHSCRLTGGSGRQPFMKRDFSVSG